MIFSGLSFSRWGCLVWACSAMMLLMSGCKLGSAPEGATIGRLENVWIEEPGIKLKAKVDTGEAGTSIVAKILSTTPAKGKGKGKVSLEFKDEKGNPKTIEKDVVKWIRNRPTDSADESRRPIVKMKLYVGSSWLECKVSIVEHSASSSPVTIGRNLLKQGKLLVDVRKKFTYKLEQPKESEPVKKPEDEEKAEDATGENSESAENSPTQP